MVILICGRLVDPLGGCRRAWENQARDRVEAFTRDGPFERPRLARNVTFCARRSTIASERVSAIIRAGIEPAAGFIRHIKIRRPSAAADPG